MSTAAIVLAGGSGSRLHHPDRFAAPDAGGSAQGAGAGPPSTNKVFVPVGGRPLIAWSVRTFAASESITSLVIVARAGEHDRVDAVLADEPISLPLRITTGGATRHASERAGLEAIADEIRDGAIDVVLIHDAARPFISSELIDRVARTAGAVGGAVPALPLGDGVYRIDANGGIVNQPSNLYRVQTPQGFVARALLDAYRRAGADGFTGVDTSETVERYTDLEVEVVPGEPTNIKVTFVDDLEIAEEIAAARV